jgi:DNA-binding CsgD family transcriptional regulator
VAIPASIVRRLSIANTLADVMEIVTHAGRTLLEADGVTFVLREGDLCFYAEEDAVSALWKSRRFPMRACISGWCMTQRKSAVIPDIYKDHRIPHDAYRATFVRSLAMVPVRQDDPIAALGAYWADTRRISDSEVELLQCLANAAAMAMAHVSHQRESSPPTPVSSGASALAGLSKRQFEILGLLAEGKTNTQIARALSRSPSTIKIHVSAILRRLKVESRTQAALLASSLKTLSLPDRKETVDLNDQFSA